MGLNRFGYAVVGSTTVALALLLVGGRAYVVPAGAFLVTAALCLAWAMRRTADECDASSHRPEREDGANDESDRREKEAKAEKTRYSGEL
jgi:hypothetical protein